jgi:hypothetical protein
MALPGVRAQLMDLYSSLRYRSDIATSRVLVIGRHNLSDATVVLYDPTKYTDESSVVSAFGEGSELHRAWCECLQAGASDIYLEAISDTEERFSELEKAYAMAETAIPDILVPYGRGTPTSADDPDALPAGTQPTDGAYANLTSTQSVALVDNEEHTFTADTFVVDLPYSVDNLIVYSDAATPLAYEEDTDFSYNSATGVVTRVTAGDITEGATVIVTYDYAANYANQLATWCERFTDLGIPCIGVIGCQPLEKARGDANDYVSELQKQAELAALLLELPDKENDLGERGKFISVVLGETQYYGEDADFGFDNGACAYAGKIALLPVQSAPTNKALYNISSLRYAFSRSQLETLGELGVVAINTNFYEQPIAVDATTYAKSGSDYCASPVRRSSR